MLSGEPRPRARAFRLGAMADQAGWNLIANALLVDLLSLCHIVWILRGPGQGCLSGIVGCEALDHGVIKARRPTPHIGAGFGAIARSGGTLVPPNIHQLSCVLAEHHVPAHATR